jgi:hypothetical protein
MVPVKPVSASNRTAPEEGVVAGVLRVKMVHDGTVVVSTAAMVVPGVIPVPVMASPVAEPRTEPLMNTCSPFNVPEKLLFIR